MSARSNPGQGSRAFAKSSARVRITCGPVERIGLEHRSELRRRIGERAGCEGGNRGCEAFGRRML